MAKGKAPRYPQDILKDINDAIGVVQYIERNQDMPKYIKDILDSGYINIINGLNAEIKWMVGTIYTLQDQARVGDD